MRSEATCIGRSYSELVAIYIEHWLKARLNKRRRRVKEDRDHKGKKHSKLLSE